MSITIRQMEPHEADTVRKLGQRAFTGPESLWVSKPKQAIVAVLDEKIVAAVLYKIFQTGPKKTGYIDYAFVDPDYHHQGVGGQIYKAAVDELWAQGCDALTAVVKDDNVGSWGLLLKNGFSRISLPELVQQFGVGGMLRHYFCTPFCIGIGMEYYVAGPNQSRLPGKDGNVKQIGSYLLANLLLFLIMLLRKPQSTESFLAAYVIFLIGGILTGYLGTLFSRRRWQFRLNNGGCVVCILVNLFAVYPFVGNWYPDHYEDTENFRRDMGVNALAGWIFVLALTAVSAIWNSHTIFRYMGDIGSMFLLYRILAFYPFESYGGRRVLCWNKWVYVLMSALSLSFMAYQMLI